MFDFNGKTVVVTGASGGMGSILCERLAAKGANLAVCSVDKEGLEKLAENLKKYEPQNAEVWAEVSKKYEKYYK